MSPSEQNTPEAYQPRRGGRFELFFYEQVGTRYYLRFTRLALVLVICLMVIPVVAIFALFLTQSHADLKNVNVDVRVPERAPGNYPQLIQPPPAAMPTPPKAGRSPRGGKPARLTSAAPGPNTSAQTTPTPTPMPPRQPG